MILSRAGLRPVSGAALVGESQVALDPADAVVAVESRDDERDVDVDVVDVHMWRDSAQQSEHDEACRKKLVKAATRAAREYRFLPQLQGGAAVAAKGLETTISFRIEG